MKETYARFDLKIAAYHIIFRFYHITKLKEFCNNQLYGNFPQKQINSSNVCTLVPLMFRERL